MSDAILGPVLEANDARKDIIGSLDKIRMGTNYQYKCVVSALNCLKLITLLWLGKRLFLLFRKFTLKYLKVKAHDVCKLPSNF